MPADSAARFAEGMRRLTDAFGSWEADAIEELMRRLEDDVPEWDNISSSVQHDIEARFVFELFEHSSAPERIDACGDGTFYIKFSRLSDWNAWSHLFRSCPQIRSIRYDGYYAMAVELALSQVLKRLTQSDLLVLRKESSDDAH